MADEILTREYWMAEDRNIILTRNLFNLEARVQLLLFLMFSKIGCETLSLQIVLHTFCADFR